MHLTINQQSLAKEYGKKSLNNALYDRGVISKSLYAAASEKIILEIDRLNNLCYSEFTTYITAV